MQLRCILLHQNLRCIAMHQNLRCIKRTPSITSEQRCFHNIDFLRCIDVSPSPTTCIDCKIDPRLIATRLSGTVANKREMSLSPDEMLLDFGIFSDMQRFNKVLNVQILFWCSKMVFWSSRILILKHKYLNFSIGRSTLDSSMF